MPKKLSIRVDFEGVEAEHFQQVRKHLGLKNDTEVLRVVMNLYYREHKDELRPSLEHFNVNENGVVILDRTLNPPKGRILQVYFKGLCKVLGCLGVL